MGHAELVQDSVSVALKRHAAALEATVEHCTLPSSPTTFLQSHIENRPSLVVDQPRVMILWKPPGWMVTVDNSGGEVDAILETQIVADGPGVHQASNIKDWISHVYGAHYSVACDLRVGHGINHRLDINTSGLLLCSKTHGGFLAAQLQLALQRIRKNYVCLCHGHFPTGQDPPLLLQAALREPIGEQQGTWRTEVSSNGRRACTEICRVAHMIDPNGYAFSLVEISLHTGRRHQIRAHLSHAGHPLVGDTTYSDRYSAWCPRIFLHAYRLGVDVGDGLADAQLSLPWDLAQVLDRLTPASDEARVAQQQWLEGARSNGLQMVSQK